MKTGDKCPHCNKGIILLIVGVFPYTIDHLICDHCDSTYCLKEKEE